MPEIFEGAVDRGLEGVVACTTAISSIVDVTLNYRGYVIEDLAAHSTFEETVFLLWNNRLPKKEELQALHRDLGSAHALDPKMIAALQSIPSQGVHPMAWLRSAVSLLAHWDKEAQDSSEAANHRKAIRLTAKLSTLVTTFERLRTNKPIIEPKADQSIAWNFFYTLTGKTPEADLVKMFDTCLVLHADHELNCSAFAARVTASSLSDIYSAMVSGICALKGPLHGGANEQVMHMLNEIGTMDRARVWVKEALENKQKVMGFGHRVYRNGDPRAKVLRQMSELITKKIGRPELYQMSTLIDDTMQKEKNLLPNVDFYSATVYYSMGIPIDLFTPVFAVSRVSGWLAHVFEQWSNNRIYRPRGKWVGKEGLTWTPIDKR